MSNPDFEASIARLTRRVDEALAQSHRFDQLAERVADWAEKWPVESLVRWLEADGPATMEADSALVALALKGTAASGDALRNYPAQSRGDSHQMLWQVALIEWERRYDSAYYEAAA